MADPLQVEPIKDTSNDKLAGVLEALTLHQKTISESLSQVTTNMSAVLEGVAALTARQATDYQTILEEKNNQFQATTKVLSEKDLERQQLENLLKSRVAEVKQQSDAEVKLLKEQLLQQAAAQKAVSEQYSNLERALSQQVRETTEAKVKATLLALMAKNNVVKSRYSTVEALLSPKVQVAESGILLEGAPLEEGFSKWLSTEEGQFFVEAKVSSGAVDTGRNNTKQVAPKDFTLPDGTLNLTAIGKAYQSPDPAIRAAAERASSATLGIN